VVQVGGGGRRGCMAGCAAQRRLLRGAGQRRRRGASCRAVERTRPTPSQRLAPPPQQSTHPTRRSSATQSRWCSTSAGPSTPPRWARCATRPRPPSSVPCSPGATASRSTRRAATSLTGAQPPPQPPGCGCGAWCAGRLPRQPCCSLAPRPLHAPPPPPPPPPPPHLPRTHPACPSAPAQGWQALPRHPQLPSGRQLPLPGRLGGLQVPAGAAGRGRVLRPDGAGGADRQARAPPGASVQLLARARQAARRAGWRALRRLPAGQDCRRRCWQPSQGGRGRMALRGGPSPDAPPPLPPLAPGTLTIWPRRCARRT
jgi:hypothetical protein